jgi:hypothetical protein
MQAVVLVTEAERLECFVQRQRVRFFSMEYSNFQHFTRDEIYAG